VKEDRYTATKLRSDIYQILDRVLETGVPAVIERGGRLLKIVPEDRRFVLVERDVLRCDPEELVHLDWSQEWRP
jgi:hypothetical protein